MRLQYNRQVTIDEEGSKSKLYNDVDYALLNPATKDVSVSSSTELNTIHMCVQ
jgi:hypothetical protein